MNKPWTIYLLISIAMLLTNIAQAGGPIGVANNQAIKYPSGAKSITLNYDKGDLGSRSNNTADSIVNQSLSLWNNVSTSTAKLSQGNDLPIDVTRANFNTYLGKYSDGINPVVFDSDGKIIDALFGSGASRSILGIAGSAYRVSTGAYLEGQAIINGSRSISTSRMTVILAHEIGHLIGLDHSQLDSTQGLSSSNYVLMYPTAYRTNVSLHPDDITSITELYPASNVNTQFGQLSGNFVKSSGGAILGANLWVKETTTGKVYSKVSDYLKQNTGYFKLLLPPGQYTLHAESIQSSFRGGSSVGPYASSTSSASFKSPHPITPVVFKGTGNTSNMVFSINAGCRVDLEFQLNGNGFINTNDCTNNTSSGTTNAAPTITQLSATPTSIEENKTSNLSVSASDTDNGPAALSYHWSIKSGQGSLSSSSVSNPVYTAPNVTNDQTITITVDISDGDKTVSKSINISVTNTNQSSETLLSENFNDGNFNNWRTVDNGRTSAPSSWQVSNGVLQQNSNIYLSGAPQYLGTYLIYENGQSWTDYQLNVTLKSKDNDFIGVMFRIQDNNNYYRFAWDNQRNTRHLTLHKNGTVTVLAQDKIPYVIGQAYDVSIEAFGNDIKVLIDGQTIFSATDSSFQSGSIAMYSWGNRGGSYDNINVTSTSNNKSSVANQAPIIDSISASPNRLSDQQTSALTVTATDPDNGPNPLTYQWQVKAGEGSLDALSSKNPVYTPPNVTSNKTFTLTVNVSDGINSTTKSIAIEVTDSNTTNTLLNENFNDANFNGWTVFDEGNISAPSKWSIKSGALHQNSNIYRANAPTFNGTFLRYNNGQSWTDYQIEYDMKSTDDDFMGVMFRIQDNNNYYRFAWDKQRKIRHLTKHDNGITSVLAKDNTPYIAGRTYRITVKISGNNITVLIDGQTTLTATDSRFSRGTIAMYTWGNQAGSFDNISVSKIQQSNTTTQNPPPENNLLLSDDFNDGDLAGWSINDEGNRYGPSEWSVTDGSAYQASNIYQALSPHYRGTYLSYDNGKNWTDYQLKMSIKSNDNDAIGVMFRIQDQDNYYRFSWDQERKLRRLTKHRNGAVTLLAEDNIAYVSGITYQLSIQATGHSIQVSINGKSIFSTQDGSFSSGSIALYNWANRDGSFDNVEVRGK